ncbi:MAG TPA: hypothetical protein VN516_04815 [Candidatus Baltobacteraceae bacterium]|nr:hypothetical protein [Candidatus Baltobacteraceae bacterium]
MSEFKYACPVCGQHISCDSSQAGTQMECPTCFQKITVPQAPATEEQKFILTGTKKSDRPIPTLPEGSPIVPEKKSSLVVVLILLLLVAVAAGIGVYVFKGKIFKSNQPSEESAFEEQTNKAPAKTVVAPPASDTNWMLNLVDVTNFPDATAAGRIHGEDFIVERAVLQNGTLTLRKGRSGAIAFGLQINFGGVQPESLAGQALNIQTNAPVAARVMMFWQDGSQTAKSNLQGYAMRLNFGQINGNRLPGKIYLCLPDESKSYLAGNFNAEIRRPKPKK